MDKDYSTLHAEVTALRADLRTEAEQARKKANQAGRGQLNYLTRAQAYENVVDRLTHILKDD